MLLWIILIILLIAAVGGGGYYGGPVFGGVGLGTILVVLLILFLLGVI